MAWSLEEATQDLAEKVWSCARVWELKELIRVALIEAHQAGQMAGQDVNCGEGADGISVDL